MIRRAVSPAFALPRSTRTRALFGAFAFSCLACQTETERKKEPSSLAGCELLSHDHYVSCSASGPKPPGADCMSYYLEGDPRENRKGCVPGRFVFAHGPSGQKAAETRVLLAASAEPDRLELLAQSGALVERGHPAGTRLATLVLDGGVAQELRLESKLFPEKYGHVALPFVDEP